MRQVIPLFALTLASLAATSASAGTISCWVENGAVVFPAALGDIAGDFILDLSAPQSQLHDTVAQGDGMGGADGTSTQGTLVLAGEPIGANFQIADLDATGWGFMSNISGVIGPDVLAGYVIDLQFAPCRLTLWHGAAPPFGSAERLAVQTVDGVPTVVGSLYDGHTARRGPLAIDTGTGGVRVARASLSRALAKGVDPTLRAKPLARLEGLSLGDAAYGDIPAALWPDAPPDLGGAIGTPVWAHYRLRLDMQHGWLELAPSP